MEDIIDFVVNTRPDLFTQQRVVNYIMEVQNLPPGEGLSTGGFKFTNVEGDVEVALQVGTVYNDNSTWSWLSEEDLKPLFKLE